MLTRKQQWRRVKFRRRATCEQDSGVPESKCPAKSGDDTNADSEDEVSTTRTGAPSISTYSSFESVHSALGESEDCVTSAQLAPPPDTRGKGVTFEPRVQVFLVTHKSELDTRAKQALWWTGRDAAMNKRAWLNHLGQPGCGRQSAGRASRAAASGRSVATGAYAAGVGERAGEIQQQPVGILGCHCQACLTEGDDLEYDTSDDHFLYGRYPSGMGARAGMQGWSTSAWGTDRGLGEKGSRSFSPASQSSSPLHDADVDVFSSAYFWDRE